MLDAHREKRDQLGQFNFLTSIWLYTRLEEKRTREEAESFFFSFWQTFVISTTNKRSIVKEGWWA